MPMPGCDIIRRALGRPRPRREPRGRVVFEDFAGDWVAAQERATGYGTNEILQRVLSASLDVAEGRAVHERDSVTFDRIEYAWPVLAALLWSAARQDGRLRVIDLGGSLGTSYRQNRRFLADIREVSWAIVEQPQFVAAGRLHFEDEILTFHDTVESAAASRPDIALLSSSLQYLPDPRAALGALSETGVTTLIIDRTPTHVGETDRITLQHVPPNIYPATYPAWIFSRKRLQDELERLRWQLVEEFAAPEQPMQTSEGIEFRWIGLVCRRT
jgi:putative methyltransferase (TIGR04325 family)